MRNPLFIVGCVAAALLVSQGARADLPPGPGYVESCTLEKQQKPGEECVACSASFEDAEACKTKHSASGLEQRCKTSGASVWTEIWCRAKAAPPPPSSSTAEPAPTPASSAPSATAPSVPPEKAGSCGSCSAIGGDASRAPFWSIAALLAAFGLRRRRGG